MEKFIKINESDIHAIVEDAVKSIIKENDSNMLIDKIGSDVEPIYRQLVKLKFIYNDYASKGSFLGSVIADLTEACNRLEHLMYIVNH